ncbi:MAG: CoA transferase [Candidatus Lambdaproteobacteria bacterium]|nr:CoA transferase [Candidatus Lambdaproteobacteria bacterium]
MSEGLTHLNVIEVGAGISAAFAGKVLADLGATVLKVEPPEGDPVRRLGPFRGGPEQPDAVHPDAVQPEAGGAHLYLNANKRSAVADLRQAAGRRRLEGWLASADLLIHDHRPGEMAAHGLDFARFARLNPRLVMLSISPFGQTGPHRDYLATDLTLVHGGGWGWICPGKNTPLELPPLKAFGPHAAVQAGLHGALAALAACRGAAASGRGDHIDLSAQETMAFFVGRSFPQYTYAGIVDTRNSPALYEPFSFYPCQDGLIYLMCSEQHQFDRLLALMGNPAWAASGRFSDRAKRAEHQVELKALISEWTKTQSADALFHASQQAKAPAATVMTYPRLEQEPHLRARKYFVTAPHPVATVEVPGAPYALSRPWWRLRSAAPLLGEAGAAADTLFAAPQGPAPRPVPEGETPPLPLAGVRVLDFTWVWAGPYCTMMLAMLGAEIVKVESSSRPDTTRRQGPFPKGMEQGINRSGYNHQLNQGKQAIGVNLSHPEGIALVKRLAAHCDVMVSNFGTGVLERLGLGSAAMLRANPNLIMAMISAFGQTGPYGQYLGYGPLLAPLAGLSAETGYQDGAPRELGFPYADPNAGVYTALAIAAALWSRDRHGTGGQVIDISLWEAMLATSFSGWMNHVVGNPPYRPMGNRDPVHAPSNLYRTRGDDTWVAIDVRSEARWRALCTAIGRPELADDARFRTRAARKANEDALDGIVGDWCAARERWEITRALQAQAVPAFPCLSSKDLAEDPHLNARNVFNRWAHPEVGEQTLLGVPWRFALRPRRTGPPAPLLGQHTDAVLEGLLGLDAAQRADLRARKVIE